MPTKGKYLHEMSLRIVLASLDTCMANIRERFERTGRDGAHARSPRSRLARACITHMFAVPS